jgi:protein TonB
MRGPQENKRSGGLISTLFASGGTLLAGGALTIILFLILPVLQDIGKQKHDAHMLLTSVDTVEPPPPPPTVEAKKPEPPPEEPPPPELSETAPPLDLSQLELALNPGTGDGLSGDFAVKLAVAGPADNAAQTGEDLFSLADLDQTPRVIMQPPPQYPADMKKKRIQGTVHVLFIVDKAGRVTEPKVQKSDNPAFDAAALTAVKRWRFEAGKKGQPVPFRMRVPITFAL